MSEHKLEIKYEDSAQRVLFYRGAEFVVEKSTDEETDEPINIVEVTHNGKTSKISMSYRDPAFYYRNEAFKTFDEIQCEGVLGFFGIKVDDEN